MAREVLAGEAAGIVVSGAPGIGKTRFAEELLAELDDGHTQVVRMVATRAAATIPLGAAATVFADIPGGVVHTGPVPVVSARPDAGSFDIAQEALVQRAAAAPLVVGIDDAHLLDEATAQLVYHLARSRQARMVLTIRRTEGTPAAIEALAREDLCARLDLQPLSRDEMGHLLARALDGQVENHTVDNLWRVSAGNVLFLRELCRDALDRGLLTRQHGMWTWRGTPVLGARLQELLDARLGQLGGADRDAAALLALGEPLARTVLAAATPPGAVDRLVERGLVGEENGAEGDPVLRLAHPLYAESLRGRLGPLETTDLYGRLAEALQTRGVTTPDDRLRLAVWSVAAGRPIDRPLVVGAARDALERGDAPLAERLARSEYPDPAAALVLGEALTALRRGQEAEEILAPLTAGAGTLPGATGDPAEGDPAGGAVPSHGDEALAVGLVVARLAAHRSPQLSLSTARQLAAEAAGRVRHPGHRQLLEAALADTLGFRGRMAEAGELALPLLEASEPKARAMAVGPACRWLVHAGRAEDAVEVGRNAMADAFAGVAETPWAPGVVVGNLGVALLATGRIDELNDLCAAVDPPTAVPGRLQGLATLLRGASAMLAGLPVTARGLLREAVLSFERADEVGHRSWALALLAEAEAMLGQLADAEQAIAAIPSRNNTHVYFDRRRTTLLVTAAAGEVGRAARQAIELADEAHAANSPFFELTAAYTAVRLGAIEEARRVVGLAPETQGLLTAVFADHAGALLHDDGDGLDQAATTFHRLGMKLLAAEAAVHASLAYRRAGLAAKARAASTRAAMFHTGCEGARTPILAQGTVVADLTRREREVALLAAQGMTSRRIAAKLGVSVRTVDNQLGRVYTKLGVAGRRELSAVVERLSR